MMMATPMLPCAGWLVIGCGTVVYYYGLLLLLRWYHLTCKRIRGALALCDTVINAYLPNVQCSLKPEAEGLRKAPRWNNAGEPPLPKRKRRYNLKLRVCRPEQTHLDQSSTP